MTHNFWLSRKIEQIPRLHWYKDFLAKEITTITTHGEICFCSTCSLYRWCFIDQFYELMQYVSNVLLSKYCIILWLLQMSNVVCGDEMCVTTHLK